MIKYKGQQVQFLHHGDEGAVVGVIYARLHAGGKSVLVKPEELTGTVEGELEKALDEARFQPHPVVGMPCTVQLGSDRYPATIIEVSPSGKTIKIQRDKAIIRERGNNSGEAVYLYQPDPDGKVEAATLRKHGCFVVSGSDYQYVFIGKREQFRDPSF